MAFDESSCPLCNPSPRKVLFDTHNFYLMASQSTSDNLIIPKYHYTAMADIPKGMIAEFDALKALVRKMLKVDFGGCVFYEHTGGGDAWSFVGHGDGHGHAHLHCAPAASSLLTRLPWLPAREVTTWGEVWAKRKERGGAGNYFYYEDNEGRKFIVQVPEGGEVSARDIMR
jgi:hypothetical protein